MTRRLRVLFITALLISIGALVQTEPAQTVQHQATLTWAKPVDAVAGTTYNVYRANGYCPASGPPSGLTFFKANKTPITLLTYTDLNLAVGNYCYYVTQVQNNIESIPSVTTGGPVKPSNVVTIQVTVQ